MRKGFQSMIKKCASLLFSLILFSAMDLAALDYTKPSTALANAFYGSEGENGGTTGFRSLLIPMGGRAESLGGAYTGLSDDVSFIDYNPASSSLINETEISLFHNAWIADSAVETLAGATRFGQLGMGGKVSCFYVPFTEYNYFGDRVGANYYSETTTVFNAAYNFLSGYKFKGLAVGGNFKMSWRSMPDYADKTTGAIVSGSGLQQSALAFMTDIGIMMRFNALKFYNSREPNIRIGLSLMNLGAAMTGFGKKVLLDDPLPATAGLGLSYSPIRPLVFSLEFRQPMNLHNIIELHALTTGTGIEVKITRFFSALAGFQLKGGNPRVSLGSEFEVFKIRMNACYTFDLTSSLNPINRFSVSAKLALGDKGRSAMQQRVDELYREGIAHFAERDYDAAILSWQEALKIDKYFDPATEAIKNALRYKQMLENYSF